MSHDTALSRINEYYLQLELVVDTETDNALVNLADDGVAILKVSAKVLVELIFKTGTHIQAHMILFALFSVLVVYHRVVDTSERVEVELLVPQAYQIVGIEVHVPACCVVMLEESIKAYLGTQLIQNAILETGAKTQTLDFSAINQVYTGCGLALMYLCLSKAHA